ncbi:DNase TatD [Salmonella enterica subsp. diarizonae]|uniref:DNase TatD n=1 Tax=Salmonella diarizonae TaxID=59204 RepID=A0A379U723_SALDZ|nr:DNase TatD [Salmonella enterica subsp. diarizonae]
MLLTGTNIHESQQALKLARCYPHCWSTAGVHPHDSSQWSSRLKTPLLRWRTSRKSSLSVSVGWISIGNFSTPQEQERAFQAQLQIAAELQMPIFMHCGTRMSDFWHCLIPGWIVFPAQYCTALPVHASKCRPVWTEDLYRYYRVGLRRATRA